MGGTSESQELYRYSQEDRHQSGVVPVVQPLLSAVMCLGYRWMGQAKAKSCTGTARKIIATSWELYRYSQEDHAHQSGVVSIQPGRSCPTAGDTRVQFNDQIHLLVVHESQLAIYDASELEHLRYWSLHDSLSTPISSAVYSCDSVLVYANFCDGAVAVFDAESLRPHGRIAPSAYLPSEMNSSNTYPLVVASHPSEPNNDRWRSSCY